MRDMPFKQFVNRRKHFKRCGKVEAASMNKNKVRFRKTKWADNVFSSKIHLCQLSLFYKRFLADFQRQKRVTLSLLKLFEDSYGFQTFFKVERASKTVRESSLSGWSSKQITFYKTETPTITFFSQSTLSTWHPV